MRRRPWLGALGVAVACLVAGPGQAAPRGASGLPALSGDFRLCQAAIEAAEARARLPRRLLGSVGTVESGRLDGRSGRVAPWPWTINVGGIGRFFDSKAEAITAVQQARAGGVQSIDVGCMQVNLMHHPNAFATLDQAFDPATNATYAAGFLSRLFTQTGGWPAAAAAYHSQTPGMADDYRRRVMALWPLAAQYGASGDGQAPREPAIDPHRIYTPEFRGKLLEQAQDRSAWAKMGLVRAPARPAARSRPRVAELGGTLRD